VGVVEELGDQAEVEWVAGPRAASLGGGTPRVVDGGAVAGERRWTGRDAASVGGDELEAVAGGDELPTAVVDPVVVVAAQADQVVRLVAAAVGPVHQVVDLDPATSLTTGHPAALVALFDEAPLHAAHQPPAG